MNTRCNQGLAAMLLLGTMGFGTTYAQFPEFSHFEFNQASNTVLLAWESSSNAFYEMQASTNLMSGLRGEEGGWTNILGTNPANQVHLSVNGLPNGFFRLLARTNSPQQSTFDGMALRANSNLLLPGSVPPSDCPAGSAVGIWDDINHAYTFTVNDAITGWTSPGLAISNNQSFFYFPSTGEDRPSAWSHAYIKDWRLISPGDLPVAGNVLIEWAAFESFGTPSNPIPDIPVIDVTIYSSDGMMVANWFMEAPVSSSVIWDSQGNPAGYYTIEVNLADLEIIEKQIYLYD